MAFQIRTADDSKTALAFDFARAEDFRLNEFDEVLPFGQITGSYRSFDGLGILMADISFAKITTIELPPQADEVCLVFILKGKISFADSSGQFSGEILENQHNIIYVGRGEGRVEIGNVNTSLVCIHFSKKAFLKIAKKGNNDLKKFSQTIESGKSATFTENNAEIDFSINNVLQSIQNVPYPPDLAQLFLYSKAIELLVLQAEAVRRKSVQKETVLKTEYDRERILFARNYLVRHLNCPPSLAELAHIAGINEFKLKNGFKECYGLSAFQYLAEVRLSLAQSELLEGKKSVSEIAFELGYSSVQHFSSAFKKKFGQSPGKV